MIKIHLKSAKSCIRRTSNGVKIIDISIPLRKEMPVWPKSIGIDLKFNPRGSVIRLGVHAGTHIDAPLHFIRGGASLNKIPLEKFIGPVTVVDLPKVKTITADVLEDLHLTKNSRRLLFRTSNSNLWQKKEKKFQKDFVGLSADAASWLARRGTQLVGIDYLSIASYPETVKVHQILLKNKVVILESLNLSKVVSGAYQLICLPLKIINTEAAPARAVLVRL